MRRASRAIVIKDGKLLVIKRNKFGDVYYTLAGGGVDTGETELEALLRELREETGIEVTQPRLVYIENAGDMYGVQHIFLCDYASGEPALDPESEEAKINALGQNTYQPMWLDLNELAGLPFRSERLKQAVLDGVANGFPAEPVDITDL